ncbi:MAG: hypothetical protein KF746_10855 [Chitinophagaceae bacterium]|nr:hypothetical protein [Chitinophagaceae bacterium]
MHVKDLQAAFDRAGKRTHFIGDAKAGVLVALDMEGRLFTIWNEEVINRVNLDAIRFWSDQSTYYNPGGDVLWPAPEGTMLGYQYATGKWRVSPAIRFAHYQVKQHEERHALVEAEVDLINNSGIGLPTVFSRDISVSQEGDEVTVCVRESVTYTGKEKLKASEILIAPWTLCQFDTDHGNKVVFPFQNEACIWDLYDDTIVPQCILHGDIMEIPADGKKRFQVGLAPSVSWIEFHHVQQNLRVKRSASVIPSSQSYIDISDADPQCIPTPRGVRYSVYNDSSNFMEIEAVGGCPELIQQGTVMSVDVETRYSLF